MALNFGDKYSEKKYGNPPELHGSLPIMRAQVVNNNDEKKIGRIQIRIPSYHGIPGLTGRSIKNEDLPWAMPCFYGGSGQDLGSFIVPIPGTYVWVMFEDNDVEKPVYLGGVPGVGSTLSKVVNNIDDDESPQQPWNTEAGKPDIPWDEFDGKSTGVPERHILYKSQKGHTIMCDDTDAEESLTIIDRIGQVIKFFCGVSKDKNSQPYRRVLTSAEKDGQLGEEVTEVPSIMIRSGESPQAASKSKLHSMIRIFQTRMRGECIDTDQGKFTTTDYDPYEYNQQTQHSILNMTEDHIFISFPRILEYYCPSYYALTAFEKCKIECTQDHMFFQYDGNGLFIDAQKAVLNFGETTIRLDSKTTKGDSPQSFEFNAAGSKIEGDAQSLHGSGKEVKFEGSGSLYTEGNKTYIVGTEIHFNRN